MCQHPPCFPGLAKPSPHRHSTRQALFPHFRPLLGIKQQSRDEETETRGGEIKGPGGQGLPEGKKPPVAAGDRPTPAATVCIAPAPHPLGLAKSPAPGGQAAHFLTSTVTRVGSLWPTMQHPPHQKS